MWDVLVHIFLIIFLPLTFALALVGGGQRSKWEWWSNLALTLSVASWAFVVGRWDMAGYYVRYLMLLVVIVCVLYGYRRLRSLGDELPLGGARNFAVILNLVLVLVFAVQAGMGVAGFYTAKPAIALSFPLENGTYHVGQGGSTVLVNYHTAYAPQAYALDIGRLNSFGYRAAGVYPAELEKYAIFGEPLYSPCTGEVVAARDDLPDYVPPERDSDHPEGNFVAINCHDAVVILAHMQQDSVLVSEGDEVVVGQPLGKVGNSGNTTEPHLHIHAERLTEFSDGTEEWVGVPIRFNGRFLGRNSLVVAR